MQLEVLVYLSAILRAHATPVRVLSIKKASTRTCDDHPQRSKPHYSFSSPTPLHSLWISRNHIQQSTIRTVRRLRLPRSLAVVPPECAASPAAVPLAHTALIASSHCDHSQRGADLRWKRTPVAHRNTTPTTTGSFPIVQGVFVASPGTVTIFRGTSAPTARRADALLGATQSTSARAARPAATPYSRRRRLRLLLSSDQLRRSTADPALPPFPLRPAPRPEWAACAAPSLQPSSPPPEYAKTFAATADTFPRATAAAINTLTSAVNSVSRFRATHQFSIELQLQPTNHRENLFSPSAV
ncbi:hypothetical protein B0H14DRAFT_3745517 [Mycena olivaceomarginata]|nr:hypothetical protein B0H14DRAFT_3745517 [Mycena olivaceomarginata]